jgi:hypothetical protein
MINEYETHGELNPKIWVDDKLRNDLRKGFLKIAHHFYEFLEIGVPIQDIILIGSNANYNWTKYSDIDLHVIVNYLEIGDNLHLVKNYLHAKKSVWNSNYPLTFKGMNIELYAQDSNDNLHSTVGIYSVLNDVWIKKPNSEIISIDDDAITQKTESYEYEINALSQNDPKLEFKIKDILLRLRNLRSSGLEAEGEYSLENLAYKHLRNTGHIERLKQLLQTSTMGQLAMDLPINELKVHNTKINTSLINENMLDNELSNNVDTIEEPNNLTSSTVVIGGVSYATAIWMKSQWELAGLSTKNVDFINHDADSKFKKLKDTKNVTKIMGFSAGGRLIWDEIMSNSSRYKFIGLIDPSTSAAVFEKYKTGGLPTQVKSLSNSSNWKTDYPATAARLKVLEDKTYLTKTNLKHKEIPLAFFKKYGSSLNENNNLQESAKIGLVDTSKAQFKKFMLAMKNEGVETKQAFILLMRHVAGEKLNDADWEFIKNQMKDVVKMIGLTTVAIAPGGTLVALLARALKVDKYMLPSSFKTEKEVTESLIMHVTKKRTLDDDGWHRVMKHMRGVEDPMGQWNHPGKCTMIPNNNITMQQVKYPVLGIDDTGDMQMMQPDKSYNYPGTKVFEIPHTPEWQTIIMQLRNAIQNGSTYAQ